LFDKPRDNPNWLIGRLIQILHGEILSLYGNHDVHTTAELSEDDSLDLLIKAGCLRLLDEANPWRGQIGPRAVVIGGSSYRRSIPKHYQAEPAPGETLPPLVLWLTHHDILIPGYDEGRIKPKELAGIDLVVNGHIHRALETVKTGKTRWITPGNISRRSRNDATRAHKPSVLRVDVTEAGFELTTIEVPHGAFDDVFHPALAELPAETAASSFVLGLSEMLARRTASGAGLMEFLNHNLAQFEPAVAAEIRALAQEVTDAQK
jgi:DNA repair exonuclease SbcCD nuclease subunit